MRLVAHAVWEIIAKAAGVSHTALQRAFRKAFGTTPGKYIMSVKMREAKRLLDKCRLNVKEIAKRTGFSSPQYFSHAYHDFYGHPPISDRRAGGALSQRDVTM